MEGILSIMNRWLAKLYIANPYVPADKQAHFISGAILGAIFYPFIGVSCVLVVSSIACLKEFYDWEHQAIHTPDIFDWFATSLGGFLPVLFSLSAVAIF